MTTNTNPASTLAALVDEAKWLVDEVMDDFYRGTLREHQLLKAIDDLALRASTPSAAPVAVGEAKRVVDAFDEFRNTDPAKVVDAVNALRDALYAHPPTAQVAERQPLTGWLPIETAPKNMSARLYLVDDRCVQGFVDATDMLCVQPDNMSWRKMMGRPTHWMPLPEAPASGEAKSHE